MSVTAAIAPRAAVFPPGPRDWSPGPFLRGIREDSIGYMSALFAEHGDAVGVRGGPVRMVALRRPEHARHVLIRNARNYWKGRQIGKLRPLAGDGVFFAEGAEWRRQRKLVVPAFQRARIEALVPHLVAGADEMLAAWQRDRAGGDWFEVMPYTSKAALDVVCRAMFGSDVRDQADEFHRLAHQAAAYAQYLFDHLWTPPLWVPTRRNREIQESLRWAKRFIGGMIDDHRRIDPPPEDLLGLLLGVRDEETGAALSDRELYDQLMTFVNAGHETTAVTLAWSLYHVGRDAALRARLEAEVDAELGRSAPTLAALARLDLLDRTIREVLRMAPPAYAVPREALADDQIDGVAIPKGSAAVVSTYFIHRHPEFWSEPDRFDPDRFLPERGESRHQFAYLPFGLGGRRCVGEDFALLELRSVLARVLQRFRVETDPDQVVVPKPLLTLKPRDGVRIRIGARASS
jgi:cytochrome P450